MPTRRLQETSFDNEISKSHESLYSLQSYLESEHEERGVASLIFCSIDNSSVLCFTGGCETCLTRIPYATLIATIMCALGVVIFCGTMYRGATLAVLMFSEVFSMQLFW